MTGVTISRLNLSEADFESAFARLMVSPAEADPDLSLAVSRIVADVAKEGDHALLRLTNELDDRDASDAASLRVDDHDIAQALESVDPAVRTALEKAAERIRVFHERQKISSWQYEDDEGNTLGQRISALDRVGIYVPGGRASYPSSVLMYTLSLHDALPI